MAQSAATQVMIVKVDIDGDMRRISITLPEDAASLQILQAIRESVAGAFDVNGARLPALKYKDDEGDLCTLVEASVNDMLELNNRGIIRLFATTEAPHMPPVFGGEPSTSEEVPSTDVEQQAQVAHLPRLPQVPAMPQLPQLPQMSEVPELPELPKVPEVPQLPELPEVPQIESAQQNEETTQQQIEVEQVEEEAVQQIEIEQIEDNGHQEAEGMQQEAEAEVCEANEGEEDTEPQQMQEPEGRPTENAGEMDKLSVLTSMGFASEDAMQALEDARGNVKLAVEFLINGRPTPRILLEKLENRVRALAGDFAEQLQNLRNQMREMVANLKQQQRNMQERYSNGEFAPPQSMQAALEEMSARLREYSHLAQAALKKARGAVPAEHEEEQLRKVQAQVADAQQFLAEALAAYRDAASEMLHRKGSSAPAETAENDSVQAEADDSNAAAMDTIDAAAVAAVDAAEMAMTAVDEMLVKEISNISEQAAQAEDTPEPQREPAGNATAMDHAQVIVSQSISAIRCRASELFLREGHRADDRVTVPSFAASTDDTADASAQD